MADTVAEPPSTGPRTIPWWVAALVVSTVLPLVVSLGVLAFRRHGWQGVATALGQAVVFFALGALLFRSFRERWRSATVLIAHAGLGAGLGAVAWACGVSLEFGRPARALDNIVGGALGGVGWGLWWVWARWLGPTPLVRQLPPYR